MGRRPFPCGTGLSVAFLYGAGVSLWLRPRFLLPADHSLVATLCSRLGVGNRASAETLKDLGVGLGESRMGTSRSELSVQLEASGANCSALIAMGDGLSGKMWAQTGGAHLAEAQERALVVGQPCQTSGLLSQPLVLC